MSNTSKRFIDRMCDELSKIKQVPKGDNEISEDQRYNFIFSNKKLFKQQIAECIKCETKMKSPFSDPNIATFTVGDFAFFLLADWGFVDFDAILGKFISKDELRSRGVYAYYDWIQRQGNRKILCSEVDKWLASHP